MDPSRGNEATRLQFGTVVSLALEDMPQDASGRDAAMLAAAAIPGTSETNIGDGTSFGERKLKMTPYKVGP